MPKRAVPLDRLAGHWEVTGLTAVEAARRAHAYGRNDISSVAAAVLTASQIKHP
jgi:Cation transporter/ATPase, N-terminus